MTQILSYAVNILQFLWSIQRCGGFQTSFKRRQKKLSNGF